MPSNDERYRAAQARIQEAINELVASGNDRGIQVAVYHGGKLIVDAVAGTMDATGSKPVDSSTLFPVFSTGKAISATVIHCLVARGLLDYDAPLAKYWPAFAAHGKSNITLRHALTHTAGLAAVPSALGVDGVCDWNRTCAALAEQVPTTRPGEVIRYHAVTQGWLIGEPACRVMGKPFSRIFADEVCKPLGLTEDLFFGIGDEQRGRVVTLENLKPDLPPEKEDPSIPNWMRPLEQLMNYPQVQKACIPASAMIANARGLAKHYAALLPGGVDGVQLLPAHILKHATRLNRPDPTKPIDTLEAHWGLGYAVEPTADGSSQQFGTGGFGGSTAYANTRKGIAVAMTKNLFNGPRATHEVINPILDELFQ